MTFVDIIGDIVEQVRAEWDNDSEPYYLYGHPLEIFNILAEKSKSESFKYSKYPLIALYQDFEESVNITETIVENITIVIMTETSRTYKAPNRYTNTFTPTLQPLYELLIKYIKRSTYVSSEDYQHTKIDRLYWGKSDEFGNSGNIGNDALDAIVISNLDLKMIDNCQSLPTYRITEDEYMRVTEDEQLLILE